MSGPAGAQRLVRAARAEYGPGAPGATELAACERRLHEPLRVALAGTLKAGKSTLLNALVGEEIAPSDATECTRVVTWYRRADAPRVEVVADERRPLPVRRTDGRLTLDLAGIATDRVRQLEVGWPSALLGDYTVIDTPGMSSNTPGVSERTRQLLAPDDGICPADVVVYLLHTVHDDDVALLRLLRERMAAGTGPLGVVGVLSRADELGGADDPADPLAAARAASAALAADPALAALHTQFLPVSGRLAVRGRTLRQREFQALQALSAVPPADLAAALISTGRFTAPERALPVPAPERVRLIEDFGVSGIRFAVAMIRAGVGDAATLAENLVRAGGLTDLQHIVATRFGERNEQLKAHAALRGLDRVLRRYRRPGTEQLAREVTARLADTHTFTELRTLATLPGSRLTPADRDRAAALLGDHGISAPRRLGLAPDAPPAEIHRTALRALRYWRDREADPRHDPITAAACRAAARSAEGVIARTPAR
ncbi:dynamin family protein [Nocardia sp. alder85J]|uniref:dynamin family protein n=1 Tax=Nocardia sp. alder85J TaxID=2862949 RepID=UPI001CD5465E|nr:dynamin family protein [Nocardia sp. alder85J]MCX4099161.1 dynamin family protein [Nocardia sp. alder85J]